MDPDFWHDRWAANQIGFHQQTTNNYLLQFWRAPAQDSRILVPLCGKSLDMHWLRQQGHAIAGIEVSPLAIEAFFAEAGLHPSRHDAAGYSRWSAGGIDLYCGDFFTLTYKEIGTVDGFYDRAALIAMPAHLRPAYVEHLVELLPSHANGLLVTMEYEQSHMDGPPFSVPPAEARALLGTAFTLEHLQTADILETQPAFRERGLQRLQEHVFRATGKH
ncbi:MAG TPA: thiopurine S-methyltransferase [Gammaproteobacteria bacterium]|jgi:thiopurine S-methyltransferase|nr:thiopurine S-methyltransferase [Gammaproteobacteria bacterium]